MVNSFCPYTIAMARVVDIMMITVRGDGDYNDKYGEVIGPISPLQCQGKS